MDNDPERIWPICSAIASIWSQRYSNWSLGEFLVFLAKQENISLTGLRDSTLWERLRKMSSEIMQQDADRLCREMDKEEKPEPPRQILNHIEF